MLKLRDGGHASTFVSVFAPQHLGTWEQWTDARRALLLKHFTETRAVKLTLNPFCVII